MWDQLNRDSRIRPIDILHSEDSLIWKKVKEFWYSNSFLAWYLLQSKSEIMQ